MLTSDWPDALPATAGDFPRHGCWAGDCIGALRKQAPVWLNAGRQAIKIASLTTLFHVPCAPSCALRDCPFLRHRDSSFALLKEGTAWHHAASGLLLAFEAVGGCEGSPGLALHNHSGAMLSGEGGRNDPSPALHMCTCAHVYMCPVQPLQKATERLFLCVDLGLDLATACKPL